jgi:hypothetical protein
MGAVSSSSSSLELVCLFLGHVFVKKPRRKHSSRRTHHSFLFRENCKHTSHARYVMFKCNEGLWFGAVVNLLNYKFWVLELSLFFMPAKEMDVVATSNPEEI